VNLVKILLIPHNIPGIPIVFVSVT